MAEYIDREQVCENCNNKNYCEKEKCPVYKVSTADVVPKSEVEELKKAYLRYEETTGLKQAKAEVARKIFAEIDVLIDDWKHSRIQSIQFIAELAELKEKYTGEKE